MIGVEKKFKVALIWSVFGQFGYLLITFLTNVFLARILSPKEFGIVAVATFFILISKVLTESGLSGALIRKKDATEIDNSTIFIFNLIVSVILYIILFINSLQIEKYYQIDNLGTYIKVLGLILIINSFQIIQYVKLVKKLEYKKITSYTFISVVLSSSLAIIFAYFGFGVWALILLQVLNSFFLTGLYWLKEEGLKELKFSKRSFKELYGFGMYTTLSSLLNTGFDNIYQLILSKHFNLNQTGFYYQAKKLTEIPVGIIKSATLGVVFSALSNIQDDQSKFDLMYNSIIRIFTIIVGLICLLIFLYSKEILFLFYGEEWIKADFFMKIIALSSFFYMQEMFNRVLFKVFDQTRKIFILELIKKSINLVSLIIGVYHQSIEILMYGYLVTCIMSYFINYYVSRTIYISASVQNEMLYTIEVMLTMLLIIGLHYVVIDFLQVKFLYSLIFAPIVIILYLMILSVLKVFNLRNDMKIIRSLKK